MPLPCRTETTPQFRLALNFVFRHNEGYTKVIGGAELSRLLDTGPLCLGLLVPQALLENGWGGGYGENRELRNQHTAFDPKPLSPAVANARDTPTWNLMALRSTFPVTGSTSTRLWWYVLSGSI